MNIGELKELQSKIIEKNKKINRISILFFVVFVSVLLIVGIINRVNFFQSFLIMLIVFIFVITIIGTFVAKHFANGKDIALFNKEFKNIFVLNTMKEYFEDVEFDPARGFSKSYIDEVGMINTADVYTSNDYLKAKYKNISFEQADMEIQEEHESTDSDGHTTTYYVTIFKGRLMIFDFNKSFKYNLQVASKYFGASSLPRKVKFNKVKMEDIDFNKQFRIYAENDHDAFYILTPHFMDKIKEINNNMKCDIMFAFVDNKLHVAINNNKDSFEANVFKPIDENVIKENIKNDIKLITDFVDELDLSNNLFRREV